MTNRNDMSMAEQIAANTVHEFPIGTHVIVADDKGRLYTGTIVNNLRGQYGWITVTDDKGTTRRVHPRFIETDDLYIREGVTR